MSNTIRLKRRNSGSTDAPTSLKAGEVALNFVNDVVWAGKGDDGSGDATSIVAIAGSGAFVGLSGTQTITGAKTFSGSVVLGSSATATTPATGDNDTSVATTAFVKAQGYQTQNASITLSGDISGSGTTSITGTLATVNSSPGTTSGVTVNGKGLVTSIAALQASDIPTLTASKISDFATTVQSQRIDQLADAGANVAMGNNRITGVADPVDAQDVATKAFVQASQQGLDVKDSVRTASTGALTLSGLQTVDGISLSAGDRVLVKNNSDSSENGVYLAASGSWTRATDFDSNADVSAGAFTFVEEGSVNGDAGFVLTTDNPITVGTTGLTFSQFSGAGNITGGDGITKTGSELSLDLKSNGGITIESGEAALNLGASSITGTLAISDGGTGATTAAAAASNLNLAIGTNTQAHSDILDNIAGVTQAANKGVFFDSASTAATFDLTAAGRALLDDADAAAMRQTLAVRPGVEVQAFDTELAALAGLTSAANKLPFFTGSGTASVADLTAFARTLLDDSDAATARGTLGVAIGSDVQQFNSKLSAIGALGVTDGNFIVANGSTFVAESGATARTSLGLGTIATQAANNVNITGGTLSSVSIDCGTF